MGFFHRFSTFIANWIRIKCVTFPNVNGFADQDGIRGKMVTTFSSRNFWSQKQRRILRLLKWSVVRGTPINQGLMFPFASRSLEAPGGERPHPTPDHTGDLHGRCPNLDIKAEQWLFIASYNFVDVFFFIESLFSWCCPTWPSSGNAASVPVQAVLHPSSLTARVK